MGFLAGIGAVALLACVGVGAAYLVKPSLFGGSSSVQQQPSQPITADPNAVANASSNVAPGNSNSNTASASAQAESQTGRTNETAKTNKKSSETKNDNSAANPGETVVQVPASEGDLPPGGMVVTKKNPDGTTTTTRIVPRPPTPSDQYNPFPPGFDPGMYRYMTPAQKQQVRDAMKRARDMQKLNQQQRPGAHQRPRPQDTPPPEEN